MRFIQNKYFPYGLLALFSVPLFFLNIHDVHSWGDDFAQYIKEAQNIAHGVPFYRSGYIYNKYVTGYAPPQYPPGFPLLLVPVVKIWGIAIRPMLYMMTIISACLLFAFFEYFRKYVSITAAVCLSISIVYTAYMVDLKANILSDVPCLLFITLYLTIRNVKFFTTGRILLLIFLATMAILIRSQAILLLVAECIYLFLSMIKAAVKNKRFSLKQVFVSPSLYIVSGALLINFILNETVFYSPVSTASFYNSFIQQMIHGNLRVIVEDKRIMYRLLPNFLLFLYPDSYKGFLGIPIYIVHCLCIIFSFAGLVICFMRRLVVDDIFFILMCLLIIFLPVYDERYFLPVIPILFYYGYTTLKAILSTVTNVNLKWLGVLLTLVYLSVGYPHMEDAAKGKGGGIPQPNDLAAFLYISQDVSDSDIIVFSKPRALTLYTNKKSIYIDWGTPKEVNKKIIDSFKAKYILIVSGLDDTGFANYLKRFEPPIDSVKITDDYMLYTIK